MHVTGFSAHIQNALYRHASLGNALTCNQVGHSGHGAIAFPDKQSALGTAYVLTVFTEHHARTATGHAAKAAAPDDLARRGVHCPTAVAEATAPFALQPAHPGSSSVGSGQARLVERGTHGVRAVHARLGERAVPSTGATGILLVAVVRWSPMGWRDGEIETKKKADPR